MELRKKLLDVFFPPYCAVCGKPVETDEKTRNICQDCSKRLNDEVACGCPICRREYGECVCEPHGFMPDGFTYALPYSESDRVSRKLVLYCKDKRDKDIIHEIASRMFENAEKRGFIVAGAVVTFAPRTLKKSISLGFDQAEELASEFARIGGLEKLSLFRRTGIAAQQKTLNAGERFENAYSTVRLKRNADKRITGKTVIVIDDVVTTGATLNACTRLLKDGGAETVYCVAASKNVKNPAKDSFDANISEYGE